MRKKRKILFIIFQSTNQANGGVESISQIVQNLRQFEPVVITQVNADKNKVWSNMGISVLTWQLVFGRLLSIVYFNLRVFLKCLFTNKLQCVHCNDINAMVYGGLGARLAGKRVIFNVRDIKVNDDAYGLKWKWSVTLASKIIVLSSEMKSLFEKKLAIKSPKKVTYIYSIVDFDKFRPKVLGKEPLQLKSKEIKFVVGIVAAVFSKKQQLRFLKEAGLLLHQLPETVFYFIGDFKPSTNAYASLCQTEVKKSGLEQKVKFVGYQTNMVEWYQSIDINLVISEREGLARGMIESLSVGTPVVSFDVPSAYEILDHHGCGVVLPQGEYSQLIEILKRLRNDTNRLSKMSAKAIAQSRILFDRDQVIDKYENHIAYGIDHS